MAKARGRAARQRRLVDKTIQPRVERDPLLHSPDDCPECVEPPPDPVWLSEVDRAVLRMQLHEGRLVDFAYVQQRLVAGTWLDVATFDLNHDEAHVHWHDGEGKRSGRTSIMPIMTQEDVDAAYDKAADMLLDQWEENLRRCTDGRQG